MFRSTFRRQAEQLLTRPTAGSGIGHLLELPHICLHGSWWLLLAWVLVVVTLPSGQAVCDAPTPWENQMVADLQPYETGISAEQIEKAQTMVSDGLRIRIVNNTIWWTPIAKTDEEFQKKNASIFDHHPLMLMITKALCLGPIPDVDFVLDIGDRAGLSSVFDAVPAFVAAKDVFAEQFITYPYWNLLWLRPTLEQCRSQDPVRCPPWENRKPVLFWRGAPTGGHSTVATFRQLPRSRMVKACATRPKLCDVGFTSFHNVDPKMAKVFEEEYGTRPKLPMDQWVNYQYMILLDGVSAPLSRSAKMAALGSVLLKQESPIHEFWYSSLVAWKHYVPISYHATDLVEKMRMVKKRPKLSKLMAANLWKYADENFTDEKISCYWHRLLSHYAKLQRFQPAPITKRWNRFRIYNSDVQGFLSSATSYPCKGPV